MNAVIYDIHPTPQGLQDTVREFYTPRQVVLPESCPSCHADLRGPEAANLASASRADGAVACGQLTPAGFVPISFGGGQPEIHLTAVWRSTPTA